MVQLFYAKSLKGKAELGFKIDVKDTKAFGSATVQQDTDGGLRGGAHDER